MQSITTRDGLGALVAHRSTRLQLNFTSEAVPSPFPAARRMVDPVKRGSDGERGIFRARDFHNLPCTATKLSRTAGIGAIFLSPHNDRSNGFVDLNRRVSHSGWECSGRQSIFLRAGARSTGVEQVHREWSGISKFFVRNQAVSAHKSGIPQARCPFCRRFPGDGLVQGAHDYIGQHLSRNMTRSHCTGMRRVQNAALRCGNLYGRKRPRIVRHAGPDQTPYTERGIGLGISDGNVDAVVGNPCCTIEIHIDAVISDGKNSDQVQRFVITVYTHCIMIGALRPFGDFIEHGLVGMFNHIGAQSA